MIFFQTFKTSNLCHFVVNIQKNIPLQACKSNMKKEKITFCQLVMRGCEILLFSKAKTALTHSSTWKCLEIK